jgi:hypothetical protein
MDEKEIFISAYAAAFMGANMGQQYDHMCMTGEHWRTDKQPVEDAVYIANKAWNQLQAHKKENGL